jgi:HK97 family phage major capsid protein
MDATDLILKTNAAAEAEQRARAAKLLALEAGRELAESERLRRSGRHTFSIVRAVNAASLRGVDGFEREVAEECARRAGTAFDPHRPWVPWEAFRAVRTLQVGTAAQGGYLVGAPTSPAVDALFAYSTVIRLGAQVFDGLSGNVAVPRVTANGTGYWIGETGTATASQPTIGQHLGKPKTVGAYAEVSRQLLTQAPEVADRMISNHLLGLAGAAIDAAAIAGTSADSSVPLGIRYTAGVTITTGTSYDNAAAQAQVKAAAAANAVDENIAFVGTPAVRELLAKRARNGTGSEYLWADDKLASKRAAVNSNTPASTLLCGDFSTLFLLFWGPGIQIEVNPFAAFQSLTVGVRVLASVDVAVTQPGVFSASVGIT